MSLQTGLARTMQVQGRRSKGLSGALQTLTLDNPEGWLTGDTVSLSRDRAMKISTVNRCVEVLSNSMAVLPVYIMQERDKQRLPEHRLQQVLWRRANEAMTSFDYERLMMCNELLRGNAYAWINRDPRTGYPRELLPLPPDYTVPDISPAGRLSYFFCHPVTGSVTRLDPADVLHYKAYSEDGIEGISVLRRASLTLGTAQAAQAYENSLWTNGGQPSGVLATDTDLNGYKDVLQADGITTKKVRLKDIVRADWERIHGGPGNAFRMAILDLGLKYQPISMNNTDAQFVESSEIRVADVCRFFGVPLHLAYAGKQSYSSNEQNGIEYVNYTLQGYETQWGQEDSYKMLLPSELDKSLRIKRELKVFLRGDTTAQAAWYTAMRNNGAYSADDIRGLEDQPKIPGGDSYYASWNYGPLERWAELSVIRAMSRVPVPKNPDGGKDDE